MSEVLLLLTFHHVHAKMFGNGSFRKLWSDVIKVHLHDKSHVRKKFLIAYVDSEGRISLRIRGIERRRDEGQTMIRHDGIIAISDILTNKN